MDKQISQELVTFIKQSPTAFHAVANMQNILIEHGYEELLRRVVITLSLEIILALLLLILVRI